jgi:hypothetical protein
MLHLNQHLDASPEWLRIFGEKRLIKFSAVILDFNIGRIIGYASTLSTHATVAKWTGVYNPAMLFEVLTTIRNGCEEIGMHSTVRGIDHYLGLGDPAEENEKWLRRDQREICEDIGRRLHEDLDKYSLIALESWEADTFDDSELFGKEALARFKAIDWSI